MHPVVDSTQQDSPPQAELEQQVVCAIPARYGSTRLAGKPLLPIAGRPMIEHVYRRAEEADGLSRVVILTDDERVAEAVEHFGGEWELTPRECASGTDRIAHAARDWPEGAVINLQGDEPLIDPQEIGRLARHLAEHPEDGMLTLAAPLDERELEVPSFVKVVVDLEGYALYFSRAPIPYCRSPGAARPRLHVGIYGYRRPLLLRLAELAPTPLERREGLEQLRALEHGLRIRVLEASMPAIGVDTEEDLARVRAILENRGGGEEGKGHGPGAPGP